MRPFTGETSTCKELPNRSANCSCSSRLIDEVSYHALPSTDGKWGFHNNKHKKEEDAFNSKSHSQAPPFK